jgi:serine/threonine protein phosphatase PrpC
MPQNLAEHARVHDDQEVAFRDAMVLTNKQLHDSTVDDSMSGTTAVTCMIRGRTAYVANVGDSRAVIAEYGPDGKNVTPRPLSRDQTPFR